MENKKKLVYVDDVKDNFCNACSTRKRYKWSISDCRESGPHENRCFKMRLIENVTTVDVVKIVYGHWERTDKYNEDSNVRCSRCKMEFDYIDGVCYLVEGVELPNYCPNCGADMRGKGNE